MIRPIVTEIALFLTPFVIYAAFLAMTRAGILQSSAWTMPRLAGLLIAAGHDLYNRGHPLPDEPAVSGPDAGQR